MWTFTIDSSTKLPKCIYWMQDCKKSMMPIPVLTLENLSPKVKGHNDISIEFQIAFNIFPEKLQKGLDMHSAHAHNAHVVMTSSVLKPGTKLILAALLLALVQLSIRSFARL